MNTFYKILTYARPIMLVISLILWILIISRFTAERRKRVKTAYDECQLQNRLKAYRLGFIVMFAVSCVVLLVSGLWNRLRFFNMALFLLVPVAGFCSFAVYAIFTDAFVSVRDTPDRKRIFYLLLVVLSLFKFLSSLVTMRSETDEIFSFLTILRTSASCDLIVFLMCLVIGAAFVIKRIRDRREGDA